ncbi:MAG: BON domain-containing protein [Burkholderiales bacterium]
MKTPGFSTLSLPRTGARWLLLASVCAALGTLSGCAVVLGGAVLTGGLVATDRRTSGTQLEDEGLELRGASRLSQALGERGHINLSAYNRQVLMTGEVPTEADKQLAEQTLAKVENVRAVVNELAVLGNSSVAARGNDVFISGKVRAGFVDAKELSANAFRVVTERSTVYLMGLVTQREADKATEIARSTSGVQRVVRIFETISEQDLQRIAGQSGKPAQQPK